MLRRDERQPMQHNKNGMESPMVAQRYDAEGEDGGEKRNTADAEKNRSYVEVMRKKSPPSS